MAQIVGYWKDNITYEEGPFVVVDVSNNNQFRIEVELKGHHCSILPDTSIYEFLRKADIDAYDREQCIETCDLLNQMVMEKKIVEINGFWVI